MEKKESDDNDIITKGKNNRRERKPDDSSDGDRNADSKTDGPVDNKKAGRRRSNFITEDNKSSNTSNANSGGGGWMTNGGNDINKKNMLSIQPDDEEKELQTTSKANKEKHFQDDNDEIVLIPDLDEDGGGDTDRIAHAPRNINRKIPTLNDLDKEMKAAVPATVDGYNLTVLLATLVPSSMVSETDTLWTFESLLREITDDISKTPKTIISAPTMSDNIATTNTTSALHSPPKHNKADTAAVNSKHDKK